MFYKTLRYRLARPLTVTRLRYNFILVSKLISEKAYYVKDNVMLQGLCPSSNCLYRKSAEIHDVTALEMRSWIRLAASKWSKTPARASLDFNCQIDLMFFLKLIVFCIPPWLTMLLDVDVHRSYTPIYRFHHLISKAPLSKFLIERVNEIPLWDFCASDFQRVLKIIIISELFIVMTMSPG